ncbi:MAG: hypothetical protein LBU69_04435 [Deltaproteobacteria bacterium]|nr:hypothetical protein [Deltaproteobacteria bacterium]
MTGSAPFAGFPGKQPTNGPSLSLSPKQACKGPHRAQPTGQPQDTSQGPATGQAKVTRQGQTTGQARVTRQGRTLSSKTLIPKGKLCAAI